MFDVAPALTASERRSGRRPGKDDRGDAVAVARIVRERGLTPATAEVTGSDLKLLVTPVVGDVLGGLIHEYHWAAA